MTRRDFLGCSAATATSVLLANSLLAQRGDKSPLTAASDKSAMPPQPIIPRWRGFNLTELIGGQRNQRFVERDFEWMATWGFNFARLPMSYWSWSSPDNWLSIDEKALAPIDEAIEFGRRHGIHINLNFHRIPGYCINRRELEPLQLFEGPRDDMRRALEAATHHWRTFARRYRDIPSTQLSFDLFNEPPWARADNLTRYEEIARTLIAAIREESPGRLIFADGIDIGQTPMLGLVDLGIVQSTRGYLPKMVSHYQAGWVPKDEFESFAPPHWPMRDSKGTLWDRTLLRERLIEPWKPLVARGAPIHVGEWGCVPTTPHEACLGWMADLLSLWKEAGWGWAMWNLRGGFGIVDSGRTDVTYENFHGHKLDRRMLDLLRAN